MDFYYPSINPDISGAGRLRFQMVDNTAANSVTSSLMLSLQVNPTDTSGTYKLIGSVSINGSANDLSAASVSAKKGEWTTIWSKEIRALQDESISVSWPNQIQAATGVFRYKLVGASKDDPGGFAEETGGHWEIVSGAPEDDSGNTSNAFTRVWVPEYTYFKYEAEYIGTISITMAAGNFSYKTDVPIGADQSSKNKIKSFHKDLGRLEAIVLDKDFNAIGVIDAYESFIWTERFAEAGDFELITRVGSIPLELCTVGNYLTLYDTDTLMMIEGIAIETDPEDGDTIKMIGRSAEALLDRRIVWSRIDLNGSLHDGIKEILLQNIIIPDDPKRQIPFIGFKTAAGDRIPSLTITGQYTGNNIYELIRGLCDYYKIGFRMPFYADENKLYFELYTGEDRSFSQNRNPYLIFSREFDNMFNSEYKESGVDFKNVTIVFGKEAEAIEDGVSASLNSGYFTTVTGDLEASSIDRREVLCTDSNSASSGTDSLPTSDIKPAGDSESEDSSDDKIPDSEYAEKLKTNGEQKLSECKYLKVFTSEADTTGAIVYGRDYALGDIVEFVSDYGIESRSRITEIIRSHDQNGYHIYPTFLCIDEEKSNDSGTVS